MDRALPGIVIGGVAGSGLRWLAGELGEAADVGASTVLIVVNALGCLVLGFVVARWPDATDPRRLAVGLGFAGGLTTFSTLAVEVAAGLHIDDYGPLTTSIPANLIAGLICFIVGRAAAAS